MQKKETKKEVVYFGIGDIWPIALALIITIIGITFGLDIVEDVDDDFTAGSYAANASEKGKEALFKLTDKLPTIALVVVAAILIGILVRNLGGVVGGAR